jgi:hypothetical protein
MMEVVQLFQEFLPTVPDPVNEMEIAMSLRNVVIMVVRVEEHVPQQ